MLMWCREQLSESENTNGSDGQVRAITVYRQERVMQRVMQARNTHLECLANYDICVPNIRARVMKQLLLQCSRHYSYHKSNQK